MSHVVKGILCGVCFFGFVFSVLPWMTNHVSILRQMHEVLEWHDIDPSRFYYSNVPQTLEGAWYLRNALQSPQDVDQGKGGR